MAPELCHSSPPDLVREGQAAMPADHAVRPGQCEFLRGHRFGRGIEDEAVDPARRAMHHYQVPPGQD